MPPIPPGGNPMQFPNPNMQQQPQQIPIPGYPVMNPYEHGFYPPPNVNGMSTQPNVSQDLFQMYMQMHQQRHMTGMGMPGSFVPPAPGNPTGTQTPSLSTTGSGNETIFPLVHPQPLQAMPSHPNSAPITQRVHENQQTGKPKEKSQPASLFSVSAHLTSEKPSALGKEGEEEQENLTTRRNTVPTVAPTIWQQPPYDNSSMLFANQMDPQLAYQEMRQDFYRKAACLICGDAGTSHNYGVWSCQGCKGFFRRSVMKEAYKKYTCRKDGNCMMLLKDSVVNRSTRNTCKECRYKKCIEVGMKKENLRLIETKVKKDLSKSPNGFPPELDTLISVFQTLMSVKSRMESKFCATLSFKKFLHMVPAFEHILPKMQAETDQLIEKLLPGLLYIRAAYTLDALPFFPVDKAKIAKLRQGIRVTVLHNEGMALLSTMFILQATNGNRNDLFQKCISGLRQHFETTKSQEPGATDLLLTKLGSLG